MTRQQDNSRNQLEVALIETTICKQRLNQNRTVSEFKTIRQFLETNIKELSPNIVICPLFTSHFDAIDVGKHLIHNQNRSKLLINAPTLPRPGMVLREICEFCPSLEIDFFDLDRWNNQNLLSA